MILSQAKASLWFVRLAKISRAWRQCSWLDSTITWHWIGFFNHWVSHYFSIIKKTPNHRCIKGICASLSCLQGCANVCGMIVLIFNIILSVNTVLLISLCKAKATNFNHQLVYWKDLLNHNCLLHVALMKSLLLLLVL